MEFKQIDITGTDLRALVSRVYELSRPVGMGFLQFEPGPIHPSVLDAEMEAVSRRMGRAGDQCVVSLDYVQGRACKFGAWRKGDRLLIDDRWYDHGPDALSSLLASPGVVNNGLVEVEA